MVVRDFSERDVGPACTLTNHYILHTPVHFGTNPARAEEFRAVWERGRATHPWLAAEIDGVFAGYAKAGPWRTREAYALTAEAGLYVVRQFQGRGVGRALYRELFGRLKAAGFHTVVAGITLPNRASVALHEALGFARVGIFREVGRKFDAWHDTGWWQLMLDSVPISSPTLAPGSSGG